MPEQPRTIPAQKLAQHLLRLAAAALGIDALEDGDDVFEEEFGVFGPSIGTRAGCGGGAAAGAVGVRVEKREDAQFAPDECPGAGEERGRFEEVRGC